MTLVLTLGCVFGTVAVAALLVAGLGPVAALMVFWLGSLAVSFGAAADIARTTGAALDEERPVTPLADDDRN